MRNKHGMFWAWAVASVLAMGAWMAADRPPVGEAAPAHPPTWTGPAAETEALWPQLVLPLLLLALAVVGHSRWQTRRHRQEVFGLRLDLHEGLEAQQQLMTLAGLLPVGISHVEEDAQGQLLARFVNPRMAELLGVRLDDLQFDAKAGWRHVHPDDLRQANLALSQAASSVRRGAPQVDVETLCRVQRDGRTRWLRTRSQLRLAHGEAGRGGVVHIHACAEDITDLRRHQKFSQDVLDGYPAPVRIRDLAGRHLLTNPAFDRMHLLRPGESVGKTDAELLPMDVQHLYHAVDQQLAANGQSQVFEQTLTDATGPHTHQVTQFLLRDEDQRPYATCAISTDVSAHRCAQDRLQRMLDTAPTPVLITNAGQVVYANRRCTDLLDVRVGGSSATLCVDPAEMARLEARVSGEGQVTAHKLRLRGAGANPLELWMTAVPTEHNGEPAVLTWLEAPPTETPARRPAPLHAADSTT